MTRPAFRKRSRIMLLDSIHITIELGRHGLLVDGRADTAQRRWTETHAEPAVMHPVCTACGEDIGDPIGVDLNKQATVREASAIAEALRFYHPCTEADVILLPGVSGSKELCSISDAVSLAYRRDGDSHPERLPWIRDWMKSMALYLAEEYGTDR